MMTDQTCATCRWWVPQQAESRGLCHGAVPTTIRMDPTGTRTDRLYTVWPKTKPEDFCAGWGERA